MGLEDIESFIYFAILRSMKRCEAGVLLDIAAYLWQGLM